MDSQDVIKANPIPFLMAVVASFGTGWGASEIVIRTSGQERVAAGSYVLLKDLQKDYVLRSEVTQEKDALAKQLERFQDKLDRIETKQSKVEEGKPVEANSSAVPSAAPIQAGRVGLPTQVAAKPSSPAKELPKQKDTPVQEGKAPDVRPRPAMVFDPPSNIRRSPNGKILCWVTEPGAISTYGSVPETDGLWYYTDACGEERGVIHRSQIEFK